MKEFEDFHVLLADDEEITREIVANIVSDLGSTCETVSNGVELLEKLNGPDGGRFDLVLTDINMPGKNGIDACAEFRASEHPRAKTLPFIGMSSDTDHTIFDNAISAGMNSMTLKPVTREVLYAHFELTLKDKEANDVFCERVQQAIAAAKAKSYFFSTVSHDIRTPLNAIIGFSQMLKMGFKTEEERIQALEAIIVSGKTLLQLINDILDLSKLESGRMTIEPAPTSCQKLLDEIAASFRITGQNTGVEIRCLAEGLPPLLLLDPQRIRQIAFNLVGNAFKFTKKGFVEVRASYEPDDGKQEGTFKLEVEDSGCGISEEDQQKIASPYVQVGSKASRNGGTGLGLAICRHLADAMGGELSLASELGRGSLFAVTIPHVKTCRDIDRARLSATQRIMVHVPTNVEKKKKHILIVDDSKMNLMVLRAMLSRLGIADITAAMNGQEALDLLLAPDAPKYDAVLTDMWMPVMDGKALVHAIRTNPKLAKLPVYVITADVEVQQSYGDMGFTDVLLKPVTIDTLKSIGQGVF